MSTINVQSIGSLEELEMSLAHFGIVFQEAIAQTQRQIQKKADLLDEIVAARRRAVAAAESACDDAEDDEDTNILRHKLDVAEDALDEAMKWQRRVKEVCAGYQKFTTQASSLAKAHASKSQMFLRMRIEELYNFVAYRPRSSELATGISSAVELKPSAETLNTRLPLPAGFEW